MIAVGIDVSKSKSTVAIISSDGEIIMKPTDFHHNKPSLTQLITMLQDFDDEVRIVMEATGHYHQPVLKALLEANLFVSVVNPYVIKKYADNEIRKVKTDKKDAMRIAWYALEKQFVLQSYAVYDKKYDDLHYLGRQYKQCVSMRVKARVQLINLLDEIMPGIVNIVTSRTADPADNFLYKFLIKYESYDKIRVMTESRFVSSYMKLAYKNGARSPENKALKVYEAASRSITTRPMDTSTQIILKEYIALLKQVENSCNAIMRQMQSIASTLPEYETILAMNGVGNRLAPILIAEIGDVRRFKNARSLNAFAGNDAPPYQSGQYEGQNRHISKRGSPELRKACYEVMQSLKLHQMTEDPIYQFMLKKEAEGKPKNVVKMAGVNKFLRIYYARVMEVYK